MDALTADRQLASVRQGCVGCGGAMWLESFVLQSTKTMIFGDEVKHSELPKSVLENGYHSHEHNGHTGTKAAFLVRFFFFFFPLRLN